MHPLWIVLLSLLLGHALAGPQVLLIARMLALLGVLGLFASQRRRLVFVALGIVLGVGQGYELQQRVVQAQSWDGYEGPVRLQLVGPIVDDRAEAWLFAPGLPAQRAFVSKLGAANPSPCGWVELRAWLPPARRNPDDRDRTRSALNRGVLVRARATSAVRWEPGVSSFPAGARSWAAVQLRSRLRPHLGQGSELWMALLLGERDGLSDAAQERFRRLGLAHLLALSGLHVGLLAALLLKALHADRNSPRALWLLPVLLAWAWIAGMGPSLFRAVVVLGWLLLGRRFAREHRPVDGLAAAGVLEILARPESLTGLAWWLSYAATLALLRAIEIPLPRRWLSALVVVMVAPLATSPWVLSAFGRMPYAGPLWNLILGAPFALLMGIGVALILPALLLPPLAPCLLAPLSLINHGFGWILRCAERVDPGAFGHPGIHGGAWALALIASALVLVPELPGRWRQRACLGLVLMAVVHLPAWRIPMAQWWSLDVGQGDGGVLRVGRTGWLVVDAGNGSYDGGDERVIGPYLQRRNARGVGLLLSHGHRDHYGGALSLLRGGRVTQLYLARAERDLSWSRPLVEAAAEHEVQVVWLERGDLLQLGDWSLRCLWPDAEPGEESTNDRSLVLRGGPAGREILLTGDLESAAEHELLARGDSLGVAVLKVAHHGSKTGTGPGLLERVGGGWALVSCGVGNRYGHPHQVTLEALRAQDWRVLRTDEQGAVGVVWTRDGLNSRSVRPPP